MTEKMEKVACEAIDYSCLSYYSVTTKYINFIE